jgi:hypothetical protein
MISSARASKNWDMPVVRISLGRFDPSKYEEVRRLLDESQTTLVPAIRALKVDLPITSALTARTAQ